MRLPFLLYRIPAMKQHVLQRCPAVVTTMLLTGALMLLGMAAARAATYYVSNGGSDANSGTSTSAPWKTCAKVNGFTFQPGDLVLFQRGGTWYEALNPTGGDGAAGNPITFADYGSGNKPHLSGGMTLGNAGFSFVGGTVWQYSSATQINAVYVNKIALIPANPNANQPVSGIPNSFYWSNGVLQINVSTNPNTDGNLYEGAVREDLICNGNPATFNFHNHLVFTNFVEEESGDLNAGYGVRIQNGTDVTLNNIESYRCGKHNFGVINATQVTVNGCLAEYPMPGQQPYGGYSAYVSYGDNSTNLPNQTSVYNNCVGDHMEDTLPNQQYEDTGYEFFTTHGSNVGSVTLNNCQALSSSAGGAGAHWTLNNSDSQQAGHPATLVIKGGVQQNNQLVLQGTGLLVDGLTMIGPGSHSTNDATATIDMECSNSTVQNLLMEALNVGYWLYQAAIQDNGNSNTIRFSTFVNDPSSYDASILNNNTTESVYGNIFVNPGTATVGKAPAYSQYNLAYTSASSTVFVSPGTGNYALAAGSPAISEVPLSLAYPPTDIVGTSRPHGNANDAGAYQYGSGGGSQQAPVVTSSGTATGTIGTAFTYQIVASNGPTSYSETGTLPAGLTFSASNGVIFGTPTATGSFPVTIGASNLGGMGTKSLTITINAAAPAAPVITSGTAASSVAGTAFSYQITATNTPTGYSATGLPTGLGVSTTSGLISGTASFPGSSAIALSATNATGTGTAGLALNEYYNVPATIEAVNFNTGGAEVGYHRMQTGGGNAQSYRPDNVGMSTTTDPGFQYKVSYIETGQWMKYNINVTSAGSYIFQARVGTAYNSLSMHMEIDGTNVTGAMNIPNTGDWDTMQTISSPVASLTAGQHVLRVFCDTYGFDLHWVAIVAAPPTITSASTATGNVGSAFSYQITATNGPTSYSETGTLPAGLTFSTSTGIISGTPTTAGNTTVTVGATNSTGTGTATLTITIKPAVPVVTSSGTASGTTGSAFSYQITATNGPTSYSETGTLPAGLTFSTSTGIISGTPTTAGSTTVTVGATNAGGTGTKSLTITVNPPAPSITSAGTAGGQAGKAFSYTITATNSPTIYGATGLPSGLSVNTSTGLISGTPTASGTFTVTLTATNAGGTGSKTLTITLAPSVATLSGTLGTSPASVNLTTEGTTDWGHWGSEGSGNWDHKIVGGNYVNAITGWTSGAVVFTDSNTVSYLWTDGPNWNNQPQPTDFYFSGGYFSFTVIADTTVRTLKVYLGSSGGAGKLTAHLSDGSSADYVDSSVAVNANGVYTITYSAASAGQTLTVTWTSTDGGRLNIQSASLH